MTARHQLVLLGVLALAGPVEAQQLDGPSFPLSRPFLGPCATKMDAADQALDSANASSGTALQMEGRGWVDGDTGLPQYMFRFGAPSHYYFLRFAERPDGGCTMTTLDDDRMYIEE